MFYECYVCVFLLLGSFVDSSLLKKYILPSYKIAAESLYMFNLLQDSRGGKFLKLKRINLDKFFYYD